jgi:hypothetical protein
MPIYRGHMDIELPISAEVNGGCAVGLKPNSPRVAAEEILLDAVDVSIWLKVSEDWVWDHASRRAPFLPAIWLSDGALRFNPLAGAQIFEVQFFAICKTVFFGQSDIEWSFSDRQEAESRSIRDARDQWRPRS